MAPLGTVTKLMVPPGSSPQGTPQVTPTPNITPHVTPVRQIGGDLQRCRRSETAPSPLPLQVVHAAEQLRCRRSETSSSPLPFQTPDSATLVVSSRLSPTEPPSPCATSRTPVAKHVQRSRTSIPSDIRALQECEKRMASVFNGQLSDNQSRSRGSSVRVRTEPRAPPPDLRTFTELVRNCGQSMRRASTSAMEEVSSRRSQSRHEVARSVTLKPRTRRREASPLRSGTAYPATTLAMPAPSATASSLSSSVKVPLGAAVGMVPLSSPGPAQRGMPRTTISASSTASMYAEDLEHEQRLMNMACRAVSMVSDPLSRTLPAGALKKAATPTTPIVLSKDGDPLEAEVQTMSGDLLSRSVIVGAGAPNYGLSSPSQPQTPHPVSVPQRLVTQAVTTRSSVERLSPRPFVSPLGRSPTMAMRSSPPATPSPATFRDVLLQRSATTVTPMGVQTST